MPLLLLTDFEGLIINDQFQRILTILYYIVYILYTCKLIVDNFLEEGYLSVQMTCNNKQHNAEMLYFVHDCA